MTHVAVGEMAYNLLSLNTKTKLDNFILPAIDKVTNDSIKSDMIQNYGQNGVLQFSEFAVMNVLPDVFQKLTLDEYFVKFEGSIPKNMINFSYIMEGNFHFINNPFPDICCIQNIPNIDRFLMQLGSAASAITLSNATRVACMLFFSHLITDLHQPLHVISRVNSNCNHDRGGNKFYLYLDEHGKGLKNSSLHQYWDSIFFDNTDVKTSKNIIDEIVKKYPCSSFEPDQLHDYSVQTWIDEALAYAPFIYSMPEGVGVTEEYENQARAIVEERIALGACRLTEMLEDVVDG